MTKKNAENYLKKSKNHPSSNYYFERKVPVDLMEIWNRTHGQKTHFRKTLKTADLRKAKIAAKAKQAWFEREVERLRFALKPTSLLERIKDEARANAIYIEKYHEYVISRLKIGDTLPEPVKPNSSESAQELHKQLVTMALSRASSDDTSGKPDYAAAFEWVLANTEEGMAYLSASRILKGATDYEALGDEYLSKKNEMKSSTKSEYRRAYAKAEKYNLGKPEDVTWETAGAFLQRIADREDYSAATIGNVQTAYKMLWQGLLKMNPTIWDSHSTLVKKIVKKRLGWPDQELELLLRESEGHWLNDVIWIALYTGHREDAIAKMKYSSERDFVWFPKLKTEQHDRYLPCHPHVREAVKRWTANPKAASTIGNRFRIVRNRVGLEPPVAVLKDFHSLRSSTTARLKSIEGLTSENIDTIVGRKHKGVALGSYGTLDLPEWAVSEVERLRPLIENVDWSHLRVSPK